MILLGLGILGASLMGTIGWLVRFRRIPKSIGVGGISLIGGMVSWCYALSRDDPSRGIIHLVVGAVVFGFSFSLFLHPEKR